jgi:hypothetical protein
MFWKTPNEIKGMLILFLMIIFFKSLDGGTQSILLVDQRS